MFRPKNGSFVSNHYVIFEDTINTAAQNAKDFYNNLYFAQGLLNKKIDEFQNAIQILASKEAQKESAYLRTKIKSLPQDYPNLDKLNEILDRWQNGGTNCASALFNFILREKTSIEDLRIKTQSLEANPNYKRDFVTWFTNYLKGDKYYMNSKDSGPKILANRAKDYTDTFLKEGDISLKQVVEKYLDEFYGATNKDLNDYLKKDREKYRKEIYDALNRNSVWSQFLNSKMKLTAKKIKKVKADFSVRVDGSDMTWRQAVDRSVKNVGKNLGGMAGEHTIVADLSTGHIDTSAISSIFATQLGKLQGKTDVLIIDTIVEIKNRLSDAELEKMYEDTVFYGSTGTYGGQKINAILDGIRKKYSELEDVFAISVNAKDYNVWNKKGFEYISSNFKNLGGRLETFDIGIPHIQNDFIFELNNTIEGAFLEDKRDIVAKEIGQLCAAYMFDDISEMFVNSVESDSGTIHLFWVNGTYFALSELLTGVADGGIVGTDEDNLTSVEIDPGAGIVSRMQHIYDSGLFYMLEGYYGQAWSDITDSFWDDVRDEAEALLVTMRLNYNYLNNIVKNINTLI